MGIPHLITFLRPYASAEVLDGQQVVLDGPAFAHQIYYNCLRISRDARNTLEAEPTYRVLADTAISWLDALRAHNVEIQKIYFDGHLPSSKFGVRRARLVANTNRLITYHNAHKVPCRAFLPLNPDTASQSLFGGPVVRSKLTALPPLPFLVPAVLEALQGSEQYGPITQVVPGEADSYCARHLKEFGGIVMTGDSDLLVHDIGSDGAVSFFNDVELSLNDAVVKIYSQVYRPRVIAERLKLEKTHGLRYLAFEMTMDVHSSFQNLLKQALVLVSVTKYPKEYREFSREYVQLPVKSDLKPPFSAGRRILRSLDPRLSEYITQFSYFAQIAGLSRPDTSNGPCIPHIFLPFLRDSPVLTNAWEASSATRQLAYGLVNLVVPEKEKITMVYEHRKQQDKNAVGRGLELPSTAQIPEACTQILHLSTSFGEILAVDKWTALSVLEDVEWSRANDRSPLSHAVLPQLQKLEKEPASGHARCTWEVIHFITQLQASYYSFRILKQMTELVLTFRSKDTLPKPLLSLHHQLQSLPNLSDTHDLGRTSSVIWKNDGVSLSTTLSNILEAVQPGWTVGPRAPASLPNSRKSSKKKHKRDHTNGENTSIRAMPSNPFVLLEME